MQKAKMAGVPARRGRRRAVVAGRRARARVRHHAGRLSEVRPLQRLQPARPHSLGSHGAALARLLRVRRADPVRRGCGRRDRRAFQPRRRRGIRGARRSRWPRAGRRPGRNAAVAAVHELRRRRLCRARRRTCRAARRELFRVAGRLQAGSAAAGPPVAPGEAIRIFTGAPMPEGADTVFMQEDVRVDDAGRALVAGRAEARRQRAAGGRGHHARARDLAGEVAGCARRTWRSRRRWASRRSAFAGA